MSRIRFHLPKQQLSGSFDAAIVLDTDDPREALAEAIVESLALDVKLVLGVRRAEGNKLDTTDSVTVNLAMVMDPDTWESDWAERGITDPDEFIASLMVDA